MQPIVASEVQTELAPKSCQHNRHQTVSNSSNMIKNFLGQRMTRRTQIKRQESVELEKTDTQGSVVRVAKIDLTDVADEAPIFLS